MCFSPIPRRKQAWCWRRKFQNSSQTIQFLALYAIVACTYTFTYTHTHTSTLSFRWITSIKIGRSVVHLIIAAINSREVVEEEEEAEREVVRESSLNFSDAEYFVEVKLSQASRAFFLSLSLTLVSQHDDDTMMKLVAENFRKRYEIADGVCEWFTVMYNSDAYRFYELYCLSGIYMLCM